MASTTREIIDGILLPLTVDNTKYGIYIEKWQNLLYEAAELEEADFEDDANWSYLWRLLKAYLIVRDLVYDSVNRQMLDNSAGTIGTGASSSGGIKKIETGVVNIERYDVSTGASTLYNSVFNKSGLWEDMQVQICTLARRLKVHVSGCKDIAPGPIRIIRGSDYSYEDQYPQTPASTLKP